MCTSLNRAGTQCARKGEPKKQLKHDYLPIFTHRSFALLPSIAEHWATTLTSCLRTICPWLTLPYCQITLLTVLLPKAFCCLFQCPILFPCCLSHLFNLAAFSFLAAGLHTETLPSFPFPHGSLHLPAFTPCPLVTCWDSPLVLIHNLHPTIQSCFHSAPTQPLTLPPAPKEPAPWLWTNPCSSEASKSLASWRCISNPSCLCLFFRHLKPRHPLLST